jgi:transposase
MYPFAMETPINITKTERVDDIPLLLAQMEKMNIAALLDKHFPMHGNWQGLSLGQIVVVWLAYILSEGDHRLNSVQGWVAGIVMTLTLCLKVDGLRELDFADDRLAAVLDRLGQDAGWEAYESEQNGMLLRVYDLAVRRVRIDSTTAKGHVTVTEGGLFQFGHSKERRPDLPQLKINQSVLDPLGMPLTTTFVSGECADDPLYVPEMRKVQACIQRHGVLYVGDCKMAALATRAFAAAHWDHYLCPLPAVQMPQAALQALLEPVWTGVQPLAPVHRPPEKESGEPEHIADGFSCTVTLAADCEGDRIEWQEQRLVVRSLKQAASQEKALEARLEKAEKAIAGLNLRGRGRKCLDENGLLGAADGILEGHDVAGLLVVEITRETQTARKRAYGKRAAETVAVTTLTACASRNAAACAEAVRMLGWRVFACNDLELSLAEAVLAYREQYVIERGFNRLRGKTLGITPLFLSSTTRIKGLVRLLGIALRVLCLVEFAVRKALQEEGAKLDGIYAGNPKRATAKPTTEMMLIAFRGLNLIVINVNEVDRYCMTALNAVQTRILGLIGFTPAIYQGIEMQSGNPALKMGEP